MRKVSFRLTDSEYKRLELYRGNKTTSEYVRALLTAHHEEAKNETTDFQRLFLDVGKIKETLTTSFKELPNQRALLALAAYMAEVASMANPPAYANHRDELKQLFQTLKSQIESEV